MLVLNVHIEVDDEGMPLDDAQEVAHAALVDVTNLVERGHTIGHGMIDLDGVTYEFDMIPTMPHGDYLDTQGNKVHISPRGEVIRAEAEDGTDISPARDETVTGLEWAQGHGGFVQKLSDEGEKHEHEH